MEYTKGKWKIEQDDTSTDSIIMTADCTIGRVFSSGADAHLISASPDLYEALKEVKLVWQGLDPNIKFPHLNEVITQAISKAEGGK